MDQPAEDVVDSRSNVVGRKRALHTSSDQGREIISIDSSSDESVKHPRKRAKQQDKERPAMGSAKVEVDLTSSPLQKDSTDATEVEKNIGQPVVWNQGVQSGLRTSFQSKKTPVSQNTSFKQPEQSPNKEQSFFSSQNAKVNLDTAGASQGVFNNKPIPTRKQLNKLPERERLLVMKGYTQEVSILIDLHGWPIPKELQQGCMKYIEDGLTFYPTPTKRDQPVGIYSFNGFDMKLQELLDVDGKPIKFEHLTYPDVLRAIMANNKDFKYTLVEKRAKTAFKAYLNHFYNHVPQREAFVSTLLDTSPPLKDILENSENAPLLKIKSSTSSKENGNPKSEQAKKPEKSGGMSSQAIAQVSPASAPVVDSGISTGPVISSTNSTPPVLARAIDHYGTNAPATTTNNAPSGKEVSIERNNSSETESKGKDSKRVAPTNVIDPARDDMVLTGADIVQIDHSSSNSIVGSGSGTKFHSNGDSVIGIDDNQDFEALHDTGSSHELTPEDRAAILKYFPTIDGVVLERCLICGSSGHGRAVCPDNTCSSCGSEGDHLTPACPQTIVCGKCRAVGHQTSHCPEKLRVAKEDIKCITCQSSNHLEAQCHLIWRSFFPGIDEIKKVRKISVSCYFCGRPDHFGPECGLYRGAPASGGITWSRTNMEKYLDDPNRNDSISSGDNDLSIPNRAKKGFSIKGKANDPIELEDSDDEEGFIRPKVNMGPRNGQIQFSQAGGKQSFNQDPFQFQGNAGGNPNKRASSSNRGGRGGGGGGSGGDKKKPKLKSGNSSPRGGGRGRGKAYRGRGTSRGRGAPRGRH
ncbi:hypothetical protein EYC84_010822 [Monilinia fructicola]|uniref:CCHC-type domain-containing protein n=1 Tax=Monilinia fructicola TaxID=38448 RepID=A0A5M9J940_MONFR|nr:hypothetical protein EYC84_010822 [Monilinia fructicola]